MTEPLLAKIDISQHPMTFVCPSCGRPLARYRAAHAEVPTPDGNEVSAVKGYRVELEPGFVNHGTRHPSGPPWYRLGRHSGQATRVRVPAVVTCACRAEVLLPSRGDEILSSWPDESKVEVLKDEGKYEEPPRREDYMVDTPD